MIRVLLFFALAALPAAADSHLTPLPPLAEAEARAWPAIGRVYDPNDPDRGFCSGALVGPNVVLTAGHCSGGTASDDPAEQSVFLAGAFNDTVIAERRIVKRLRHPAYRISGTHTPDFDIGIWVLDSAIDDITPLPLGKPEGDTFALLGYHRLIPYRLSGRTDCPVRPGPERLLVVGCRVISGNSGSPVIQIGSEGATLVAVTSSQSGGDAIAVPVSAWAREVIATQSIDVQ